jgi:hypothetical protein
MVSISMVVWVTCMRFLVVCCHTLHPSTTTINPQHTFNCPFSQGAPHFLHVPLEDNDFVSVFCNQLNKKSHFVEIKNHKKDVYVCIIIYTWSCGRSLFDRY